MTRSLPIDIAIAVVQRGDEFLIGQRPADVVLGGCWEFPGGKVEPGEAPEDAAARECFEESGLKVRVRFAYPEHTQQYEHGAVRLMFFACSPLDATVTPRAPYRWVSRCELQSFAFPEGNRGMIELLTRG